MNILIVGCGKLGQSIVSELNDNKYAVVGVKRHADDASPEQANNVRYLYVDAATEAGCLAIKEIIPKPDRIIVTASPGLRGGGDNNLLALAQLLNIHFAEIPLIYTSSTYVYAGGESVNESSAVLGDDRSRQLLAIESVFLERPQALILRVSALLGPRRNYVRTALEKAGDTYAARGPLSRRFNYIHDADAAEIIVELLDAKIEGVYNLSSANHITARAYFEGLVESMKLNCSVVERDQSQVCKNIDCAKIDGVIQSRHWRTYLDR